MDSLDFVIRSGRAVFYPVYKGTYERRFEGLLTEDAALQRERMILWFKDFGRSIDYLETRPEIDREKLGYHGFSMGGMAAPVMLALDRHPRVAVFLDGGFTLQRRLPEGDSLKFAPRVTIPVLMLNSRHDFIFPVESSQIPMFRTLGAPEKDKRHVVFDTAHNVMSRRNDAIREVLDWLDRYLGPVRR